MEQRDLSWEIAEFFAENRYEKLPQSAIDGAKKSIIDTLGVCLAASGKEPAVRAMVDFVQHSGG
ncbi:MAG: MmgE/PrpD family protein, partial [Mesorhizobium sp.]